MLQGLHVAGSNPAGSTHGTVAQWKSTTSPRLSSLPLRWWFNSRISERHSEDPGATPGRRSGRMPKGLRPLIRGECREDYIPPKQMGVPSGTRVFTRLVAALFAQRARPVIAPV